VLAAFPFNRSGIALYDGCGFREVDVCREQGMLDGRWVDVVAMERLL
jgi:L-amino acid N-acyltransferase YncA